MYKIILELCPYYTKLNQTPPTSMTYNFAQIVQAPVF